MSESSRPGQVPTVDEKHCGQKGDTYGELDREKGEGWNFGEGALGDDGGDAPCGGSADQRQYVPTTGGMVCTGRTP